MKVVGLVSGGKDSCYNLMQCVSRGHEIVCLANLHAADHQGEMDSYMFGSEAVQLYAAAMQLPLYTRIIGGKPLQIDQNYDSAVSGDEVEDLYQLLKEVVMKHPDVQGVSVGAIHSSYQNVRVENVCARLKLDPLAYLWHMDQAELLDKIINSGIHAIVVKVAALGLNSSHVGQTLSQLSPHLHELHSKYGVHLCGEGGEYETLVLDCPLFKRPVLWMGRAEDQGLGLPQSDVVLHAKDDVAPVVYLKLHGRLKLGDLKE